MTQKDALLTAKSFKDVTGSHLILQENHADFTKAATLILSSVLDVFLDKLSAN